MPHQIRVPGRRVQLLRSDRGMLVTKRDSLACGKLRRRKKCGAILTLGVEVFSTDGAEGLHNCRLASHLSTMRELRGGRLRARSELSVLVGAASLSAGVRWHAKNLHDAQLGVALALEGAATAWYRVGVSVETGSAGGEHHGDVAGASVPPRAGVTTEIKARRWTLNTYVIRPCSLLSLERRSPPTRQTGSPTCLDSTPQLRPRSAMSYKRSYCTCCIAEDEAVSVEDVPKLANFETTLKETATASVWSIYRASSHARHGSIGRDFYPAFRDAVFHPGPHKCLGMNSALLKTKSAAVRLISKLCFKTVLSDENTHRSSFSLPVETSFMVRVTGD